MSKKSKEPKESKETGIASEQVQDVALAKALGERYLSYALSTIIARSLPDVRDGLKPVHRRILYAMKNAGNTASKPYRKSAHAVGYVMMHYHPHGDMAIYDALVRMAQDFSMRYPLIDGQGNFGSIDGDNAAAFRYTEARLSTVAETLLTAIDEDAVDFQGTYNGQGQEPLVLPSVFPNLLANGATGIAVGMATTVPPHNVGEICDALRALIRDPELSVAELLKRMPGPDFPTGGMLVESREAIQKSYESGRGTFRLRARWEVETLKGGGYQIVITQIPYQVQKAKLMEKIGDLMGAKKLPLVLDVADESAADIRLVITPRNRSLDDGLVMESLFRQTDLEVRFPLNMNVLDRFQVPRVMSLKEVLQAFLDHRQEVLLRRSTFRQGQIQARLEVLRGLQVAYLNLDAVIQLIRQEDHPKPLLMARWSLTEVQAEAILNMKLRALRKLEEYEITQEIQKLTQEQTALEALLQSPSEQWRVIDEEIKNLKKGFGDPRRTLFGDVPLIPLQNLENPVEVEPVTIVCSAKGWIRTVRGHVKDDSELKYKDGDSGRFVVHALSSDKVIIFAQNGKSYALDVQRLPGGRGQGEPLRLMIDLPQDEDIVTLFPLDPHKISSSPRWLVASSEGKGFLVSPQTFLSQKRGGRQVLTLPSSAKASVCIQAQGDTVAIIGENRKFLVFPLSEIPELTKGRGVTLQKYKHSCLGDVKIFNVSQGLSWVLGTRTRHVDSLKLWQGKRGQVGKIPPVGFPRNNKFQGE